MKASKGDKETSRRDARFYIYEHRHSRHDDHRERFNAIKNPFTLSQLALSKRKFCDVPGGYPFTQTAGDAKAW